MAKITPNNPRINDKLLIIGRNEVNKATMPSTKAVIAMADFRLGY